MEKRPNSSTQAITSRDDLSTAASLSKAEKGKRMVMPETAPPLTQASTPRDDLFHAASLPKAEKGMRRVMPGDVETFLSEVYAEAIASSMASGKNPTIRDKLWTISAITQRSSSKTKQGVRQVQIPGEAGVGGILENIFDAEIQYSLRTGKKVAMALIRKTMKHVHELLPGFTEQQVRDKH